MAKRVWLAETFERLTGDLAKYRPELSGMVLCPLCLRTFDRAALEDRGPNGLSEEHVVPRSVGGRICTLTCRRCNNTDGSRIDSQLELDMRLRQFAAGTGPRQSGYVRVDDLHLPIWWSRSAEGEVLEIKGGPPIVLEAFGRHLQAMREGDTFNLTIKTGIVANRVRRAMVRIAYLAIFESLGYHYVLSDAGHFVRSVLAGEHEEVLALMTPVMEDFDTRQKLERMVVVPIGGPEGIVARGVLVPLGDSSEDRRVVFLP